MKLLVILLVSEVEILRGTKNLLEIFFFFLQKLSLCAFQFALGEVRTYGRPVWNGIAGRAIVPIPTICNSSDKILKTYCDGDPLCDAKNVIVREGNLHRVRIRL